MDNWIIDKPYSIVRYCKISLLKANTTNEMCQKSLCWTLPTGVSLLGKERPWSHGRLRWICLVLWESRTISRWWFQRLLELFTPKLWEMIEKLGQPCFPNRCLKTLARFSIWLVMHAKEFWILWKSIRYEHRHFERFVVLSCSIVLYFCLCCKIMTPNENFIANNMVMVVLACSRTWILVASQDSCEEWNSCDIYDFF